MGSFQRITVGFPSSQTCKRALQNKIVESRRKMSEAREKATEFVKEERFFDALAELEKIDASELTDEEKAIMEMAKNAKKFVDLIGAEKDKTWTDLGESKKNYRLQNMKYKMSYKPIRVDMVISAPVEESLVTSLVAVLNEIDLYNTWLPNWSTPKFKVDEAKVCKKREGRFEQTFNVRVAAPMNKIEFYSDSQVVDDTPTNKQFVVYLAELEEGARDGLVPPVEEGAKTNRVVLSGGMSFSECPQDLSERAAKLRLKGDKNAPTEKYYKFDFVVTYQNKKNFMEPNFFFRKVSNFVLSVVIGALWGKLVTIAEEVRDGKRPEFAKKMEENKDIYEWAVSRVRTI